MAQRRGAELPACYAMVMPGLEEIAAEEIAERLGDVKRTAPGLVVFRVDEIDRDVLKLSTTEDVFVLAWGTDQLTRRAKDLQNIRRWTSHDADWDQLLRIHHAVRPKPKGKPTYRLVVQMQGQRGYRRIDAREALAKGLAGKLPSSWKHADENASIEIWLTIDGATAVCGVRLSDREMRHRRYKLEHVPASLRPTLAAAMVRLAELKPGQLVLDPCCGAGTILAESLLELRRQQGRQSQKDLVIGGDIDRFAVRATKVNLDRLGPHALVRWDAVSLPLPDSCIDGVISNPPFGKQIGEPEELTGLYEDLAREINRVTRPGGRIVLLLAEPRLMKVPAKSLRWKLQRNVRLRLLGQKATILVYGKPE